jgi:hypothetical protein
MGTVSCELDELDLLSCWDSVNCVSVINEPIDRVYAHTRNNNSIPKNHHYHPVVPDTSEQTGFDQSYNLFLVDQSRCTESY